MEVWMVCAFVLLLSPCSRTQDTVAEDIGPHQLERLAELLTLKECEDLVVALSTPEEDIFKRLELLAPEKNQLGLQPVKRALLSFAQETEAECRKHLTDWLVENGEQIYYDRLTRALQHIGRNDIAIEVGKNINQDTSLSLRRYVENYHKIVSSFGVPEEPAQATANKRIKANLPDTFISTKTGKHSAHRTLSGVSDLIKKHWGVIVERAPLPPYTRTPLDVVVPVAGGILLAFFLFIFLFIFFI